MAAGIEILEDGGTAADAAVAACLASCVAETVMTGLLGGGHAIYWDGNDAWSLDCFVDVPSGTGAPPVELKVPFGEELVHYAVGPGTCAVPGLPRGLGALHARFGRLPWSRLVEPALGIARRGVTMPPAHAACLAMLAPVFTMQPDGRRIYAPAGRPLEAGEQLDQPGLVRALELLTAEGPDSPYVGSIAESL
ncbi:MAG: gamma-glutamyltranspeptidase / glutathione hydrolase, partial [Gaiellaceae bacterium]|nr:gamma-glutamyltranspeptidase / glutathione hydrolase [Gaiellaceae bacterium]